MKLLDLLATFCFAATVQATSILLPLYVYPDNTSSWQPLLDAATAHPTITIYAIVNLNSGPGPTSGSSSYPVDTNYIAGITGLNAHNNIKTLGYVHSVSATLPYSQVTANITRYASWSKYSSTTAGNGKNITISGIFFDESPNDVNQAHYTYMANASSFARNHIKGAFNVFNPGAVTPTQYYSYADQILAFEDYFSVYQGSSTLSSFQGNVGKSAVVLHNTPAATSLTADVHQAIQAGLGSMYFCQSGDYSDLTFVGALANAIAQG